MTDNFFIRYCIIMYTKAASSSVVYINDKHYICIYVHVWSNPDIYTYIVHRGPITTELKL